MVDEKDSKVKRKTETIHGMVEEHVMIDDKHIVPAVQYTDCVPIKDYNFYTIYHLVLENDGNPDARYCIWANGMLSETPSEQQYNDHVYMDLNDEHYSFVSDGKPLDRLRGQINNAKCVFIMRMQTLLQNRANYIQRLSFNKNIPQRVLLQEKQAAQIFRNVVMSSMKQMRENFPDRN